MKDALLEERRSVVSGYPSPWRTQAMLFDRAADMLAALAPQENADD